MTDTAKRLASEITKALASLGVTASNVMMGRFGLMMDLATEADTQRAVEYLKSSGATEIKTDCFEGEWLLVCNP